MAHVVFQVKVFIVHPVGVIQLQRHPHQAPAQHGTRTQPGFHVGNNVFETHRSATGYGAGIKGGNTGDMGQVLWGLHVEEL